MFELDKFYVRSADGRFRTSDDGGWGALHGERNGFRCVNPHLRAYDSREQALVDAGTEGVVVSGWELLPAPFDPHRTPPSVEMTTYTVGVPGFSLPIQVDLVNAEQRLWAIGNTNRCRRTATMNLSRAPATARRTARRSWNGRGGHWSRCPSTTDFSNANC